MVATAIPCIAIELLQYQYWKQYCNTGIAIAATGSMLPCSMQYNIHGHLEWYRYQYGRTDDIPWHGMGYWGYGMDCCRCATKPRTSVSQIPTTYKIPHSLGAVLEYTCTVGWLGFIAWFPWAGPGLIVCQPPYQYGTGGEWSNGNPMKKK